MNDAIRATGEFSLSIYNGNQLIECFCGNNLVVDLGKTNIARLLAGAGSPVTQIAAGTNAVEPAAGDNTITGAFVKAIDEVSYPETNSVMFSFSLNSNEANGLAITEFGLLSSNNNLIARKTRSPIQKSNTIRIVGTWKIVFN